ncbi:MAG: chromate transporter [Clostridiaceae bacterium]|nr:chromate transporter [Clostridia bacterium]MDY3871277.1 chromate transporter [Clostridiaceae bacterium]
MMLLRLFYEFFKVGLFAIGGGMATFPFLTDLAAKTGWYTQAQLVDMVAIAESTPGPIGVNTATYVGFTVAGIPGALTATIGLITPSVIIILIIARVLARFRDSKLVQNVFYGLRPASTGLIAAAGFSVVLLALTGAQVDSVRGLLHWQGSIHWPSILLAAVLLVLTRKVKQTKNLHPVVFIALSAVVGIVFRFAGV